MKMAELQEKMLCLISLVYLTGLVAGGSIDTIDFDGDLYEGDDRSIFSSGGTYYIALNTTYVIYAAIIAGVILIGGALISKLLDSQAAPAAGYGNGYQQRGDYGQEQFQGARLKRQVDDNFTNQLYLLAEAFNKYEVTETECQLYVACESSQVPNQTGNLRLNKIVFQIMSNINTEENEAMYKDDPHMSDLMKAFKLGFLGSDCSRFRSKCSNPIV
ncbi:uncharacterized protein LOC111704464 isoform X1 [Eurytemora carolleeae]|uniref:uncharacterized protein LOC111704464 isoform X1 n=1 Tax=Eurytemora carolleeae TaxID=1294199 RepID=UPI000C784A04|nr:uncharacterized protein LOC111704464 isoform X1 [Eurytemora carolleeae]|eukprot:XP_023332470.1 uncharacterized protein LOC111704464 isoform X1 [Eurytemora affinis]